MIQTQHPNSTFKPPSKTQLLSWIHSTLHIKIQSPHELGTGLIYCLLLNHYHPKLIPQTLVNHFPRGEHDYIKNLKLFQSGLVKLKSRKKIDIEKVSKMKFQDNWETICWLKRFLDEEAQGRERGNEEEGLRERGNKDREQNHGGEAGVKFNTLGKLSASKENIGPLSGLIFRNECKIGGIINGLTTPVGKSSVTAALLQTNYLSIIDRMKQVLMGQGSDQQKIKTLSMLLNINIKKNKQKQNQKQEEINFPNNSPLQLEKDQQSPRR